jgi:hypothetical protein
MIVYAVRDDRNRWLEYAKALPPRTPSAGLTLFQQAVSRPTDRAVAEGGDFAFSSSRPSGTLTGQPTASAAATPSRIRASASGRREHRNRLSFCSIFSAECITHPLYRT